MGRQSMRFQQASLHANGISIPPVNISNSYQDMMCKLLASFDTEINEVMLSHGSTPEKILSILSEGLNERFSSGIFGSGTYFADDITKNDQYCTPDFVSPRSGPGTSVRASPIRGASAQYHNLCNLHDLLYNNVHNDFANVFYVFFCRVLLGYPARTQDGSRTTSGAADIGPQSTVS